MSGHVQFRGDKGHDRKARRLGVCEYPVYGHYACVCFGQVAEIQVTIIDTNKVIFVYAAGDPTAPVSSPSSLDRTLLLS